MRRMLIVCAGAVMLLAACGRSESTPAAITGADAADMAARAVEAACRRHCAGLDVYVVDQIFSLTTLLGREVAMPSETQQAILDRVDGAQMITLDQYHAMFEDELPIDPRAAIVNLGPIVELRDDVVGIDIYVGTRRDALIGETYQFRWTGEGWEPATPEDTGITVTTAVS